MSHEDNYADLETIKFLVDELVVKEKTIVTVGLSSVPNAKIVEESELPPWPSDYQYHIEKD